MERRPGPQGGRVRYRSYQQNGWEILVGKGAADNDRLTLEIAEADDLWLHVAEWSGSHVVIRVPENAGSPPHDVIQLAARLAAWHSKARGAKGKVEVHLCRAGDVRKPRGFAPGKVQLKSWTSIKVYAKHPPTDDD